MKRNCDMSGLCRELQDRNAKLMQQRAEEEMRRKQQEIERVIAERKAWAQAKLEQRLERISRAAEERKKRDAAYCQLLETTREYAPHAPPQGRFYCSTLPRYSWSQCWGAWHTCVCAPPLPCGKSQSKSRPTATDAYLLPARHREQPYVLC